MIGVVALAGTEDHHLLQFRHLLAAEDFPVPVADQAHLGGHVDDCPTPRCRHDACRGLSRHEHRAHIERQNVIVDPGIGFGKTLDHNLALLRGLPAFASLGQPLMVGASRKAFIGRILGTEADQRLEGSLAAAVAAVMGGADIVRVHDVKETRRAIRVADAIRSRAALPERPSHG